MALNKTSGQALLIILLAIGSYALLHENDTPSISSYNAGQNKAEKPSAFIKDGQFKIYDKNGQATNLSSKKALYYSDPKRILIQSPSISFKTSNGQTVTLNAKEGVFHPEDERLLLSGGVIIQQSATTNPKQTTHLPSNDNEDWILQSEEFELNNKSHFISTDQAVTMTKGQSLIRAVGLNTWIDENKIELLSNVRGRYVFN